MLTTVEGGYHDGKFGLSEVSHSIQEDMFVLVTLNYDTAKSAI